MSNGRNDANRNVEALPDETDHSSSDPVKNADHGGLIVGRPPLFFGILPANYQTIAAAARIKEFARDEMLFREGDSVEHVILLTSGFVKITQAGSSGNQVILRLGVPGDILGATSLYSTGTQSRAAQAFPICQTLVWDARTFKALVDRLPVLHQNMVRLLSEDLQEVEERFREVATEKVAPRVAGQVLRLVKKIGQLVNGEVEIRLSREELAQMTGTTLFTVSRLISAWETRGVVKSHREGVTICDIASLRTISGSFLKKGDSTRIQTTNE